MTDGKTGSGAPIALFQQEQVRRTIHSNEGWFVISDVVSVLTDSPDPGDSLKKIRKRDLSLSEG